MFVLSGKKIINSLIGIFFIILIGIIGISIKNEPSNYVSTVSLPVSVKTVVIDARSWYSR